MNGQLKDFEQLRVYKKDLIREINAVARAFVNQENLDPIAALNNAEVQKMVNDLNDLKVQLISFLDALEKYMQSADFRSLEPLQKMLESLEKLQQAILKLDARKDTDNVYIKVIRSKITILVNNLLQPESGEKGLIDKILDIVPKETIQNLLATLKFLNVFTAGYGTTIANMALQRQYVGGSEILNILNRLKLSNGITLTEAMLNSGEYEPYSHLINAEEYDPLKPMKAFLEEGLNKLKSDEKAPTLAPKTEKPITNEKVRKAKIKLIDAFDDQVRLIVKHSDDVLAIAADKTVQNKIKKLDDLKQKLSEFLYAVDDYLESKYLGINELSNLVDKLAKLENAIQALVPNTEVIKNATPAAVQIRINEFIGTLDVEPVIDDLLSALNKSFIFKASLFLMQLFDNFINYATTLLVLIDEKYFKIKKPLSDIISNLSLTSLPQIIKNNKSKTTFEIMKQYFDGMLNKMIATQIRIEPPGGEVTMQELIRALNDKNLLQEDLKELDSYLDKSEKAMRIRSETVNLILFNDRAIFPEVERSSENKDNFNQAYLDKVVSEFKGANGAKKILMSIANKVMKGVDEKGSSRITISYDRKETVESKAREPQAVNKLTGQAKHSHK